MTRIRVNSAAKSLSNGSQNVDAEMGAPNGLGSRLLGESRLAFAMRLGYLAIAAVSLVPGQYRPSSVILPDTGEHALAYLLVGGLSVLAMRISDLARTVWLALAI